jgi:hypothetical protein
VRQSALYKQMAKAKPSPAPRAAHPALLRACIFYALGGKWCESADETKLRGHVQRQAHTRKIVQPNEISRKEIPEFAGGRRARNTKPFAKEAQTLSLTPGPRQQFFFLCVLREGGRAPLLTSRPERASDMHPHAPNTQAFLPACLLSTARDYYGLNCFDPLGGRS